MTAVEAQSEAAEINDALRDADPEKIVSWAHARFGRGLVMTSSFGAESALLIHMATRVLPDIRIIMVDTGYLFPETHAFMEQLRQRFNLNVWVYRTRNDPSAYLHHAGEENPAWRNDTDRCCAANKREPMERAMKELAPKAWLRGVRGDQTEARANMRFVEWFDLYNCFAISPLLKWKTRDIYSYMKRHDLPYHPLYEQGYPSISCNPISCTDKVQVGEDPRSGRWHGKKAECGINLNNSLDSANL
jgi:phosphoadenosine phosphosulfate reductase